MAITKKYTTNRELNEIQDNIINGITQLTNTVPFLSGVHLRSVSLVAGTNMVNHPLNKILIGIIITNRTQYGSIRLVSSTTTTMTMNVEASGVYDLWVF